jgi:single-strand DNA-binding protein
MDLNSITLTGRLTQEPELHAASEERSVCRLRVAYSQRSTKQPSGFVDVEVWGPYGETCAGLAKGARVGVAGALHFSEWEGQDGQRRQRHVVRADNVAFLSPKAGEGEAAAQPEGEAVSA